MKLTRRAFVGTLRSAAIVVRTIRAVEFNFTQYSNQVAGRLGG